LLYTIRMYVATVPNRNSPPAILLRESFREDGKVKNRTLANLSSWPSERSRFRERRIDRRLPRVIHSQRHQRDEVL